MDQYIGKMLDDRYEILERIGTGGMAVVYKARCHRLNRLVAIKILKPELASDADLLRRFHDESQAVAMLSHTNIVSIYDVCHSDGLDYIVMELIDGMTLKQYMQKRGTPLNWREALHFITQIVRALGHAHSRGIIHRDIKPHNIMVLRDGSVKVADFGIARLASSSQSTLTQEALGSVHYISPEQAKGSRIDGRSDLYSAGVVLYEMLTGRLPFEGDTPVNVAIQHINSIPIPPRELNPDIPPALEAITMKAMAPDPDQRYSSADEMLEDLKKFRKNPGVELTAPAAPADEVEEPTMVLPVMKTAELRDAAPAAREESRRSRPAHKPEPRRRPADDEEDEDEPRRRRGIPPMLISVVVILLFVVGIGYFLYSFFFKGVLAPPEEYTIPDLRGYTIEELEKNPSLLSGFSFEVGPTVYSTEYPEDQVCRQVPEPNTTVKNKDATITVTISGGEDKDYMISVDGWDARKALTTLQDEMGLIVHQEYEFSPTITKGYVISCTLLEGTLIHKGDEVTIVISKGLETIPVSVTSFVGVDIEQVRGQVESLGLKFGQIVDYEYSDEYPEGRVTWQSIEAYTEVDEGTVINFKVSKGPEPVETPEPTPSPEPSPDISDPPEVVPTTRSVQVDLSGYEGSVAVRIVVGAVTLFDGTVDASVGSFSRDVTGTGSQLVSIYINGDLLSSYELQF